MLLVPPRPRMNIKDHHEYIAQKLTEKIGKLSGWKSNDIDDIYGDILRALEESINYDAYELSRFLEDVCGWYQVNMKIVGIMGCVFRYAGEGHEQILREWVTTNNIQQLYKIGDTIVEPYYNKERVITSISDTGYYGCKWDMGSCTVKFEDAKSPKDNP